MQSTISVLILSLLLFIIPFATPKPNWQNLINSSLQLGNENKQIKVANKLPSMIRPTLLFIGDSIILSHYSLSLLCTNTSDIPPYDSVHIGDWKHLNHMINDVIPDIGNMKGHLDIVILNFAVLHNLQRSMTHDEYSTEFRLMSTYFEAMMQKEILAYINIGATVIITTPPKICDEKYYGDYKHFVDHKEEYLIECSKKIKKLEENKPILLEHTKLYDDRVAQPYYFFHNLTNITNAYNFCAYSTMDMHGSALYAERIITFVKYFWRTFPDLKDKLNYFDYHSITKLALCEYNKDGRHYNETFQRLYAQTPFCEQLQNITHSMV